MSMLDPFNPRPGPLPGEERRDLRRDPPSGDGGKTFLWVPVAIVGGIGVIAVVAAL